MNHHEVDDNDHVARRIPKGHLSDDCIQVEGSGLELDEEDKGELSFIHVEHYEKGSIVENLAAKVAVEDVKYGARDRYAVFLAGSLKQAMREAVKDNSLTLVHTPGGEVGVVSDDYPDHVSAIGLLPYKDCDVLLDSMALAVEESYNSKSLPGLNMVLAEYGEALEQLGKSQETASPHQPSFNSAIHFLEGMAVLGIKAKGGLECSETGIIKIRWDLKQDQWAAVRFNDDGTFGLSASFPVKGAAKTGEVIKKEIGDLRAAMSSPGFAELF